MRVFARRALTLATLASIGVLWSGCTAKEQSEYVSGISTQMNVPRDLRAIRVSVSVGGFRQFCRGYPVYEGKVTLPRSLGVHALNDPQQSGPVTFGIVGYDKKLGDGTEFADEECDVRRTSTDPNDPKDPGVERGIRLLRRSRQPYVKDQILFLPMPLKYACMDVTNCGDDQTCKAGKCVDNATDPATLPEFNPDMVDGLGGACFRASECFAAAAPAIPVDPATCTFAVANTKDEPPLFNGAPDPIPGPSSGDGVNVEITYDGGYNREILDKEKDEGFIIPDPAKPQQFRLTAGLCDMWKGNTGKPHSDPGLAALGELEPTKHRITGIRASGTCQAKSPFQPICANDQLKIMGADPNGVSANSEVEACKATELKPPKALLMLVVDNTEPHKAFFSGAENAALAVSLADPAFEKTEIGLVYGPGPDACAGAAAVDPKLARVAKDEILTKFSESAAATLSNVPWALDGALSRASAIAKKDGNYYRRAIVVLGSQNFATDSCPGNGAAVVNAVPAPTDPTKPVQTYVILLAETKVGDPAQALTDATLIAQAGGTSVATDARGPTKKIDAFKAFQTIVKSLATCAYDFPTNAPKPAAGDVLSYQDPLFGTTKTIPHNAGCNSDTAVASGWGMDDKRMYVCGQACEDYRNVLSAAQLVNAGFQKAAPPVPMFAHKAACAPKPGP